MGSAPYLFELGQRENASYRWLEVFRPNGSVPVEEYVELLAATGAAVRAENPGMSLSEESVRLLERFGIESEHWVETVRNYRRHFFSMVGHVHRIAIYCARVDRDNAKGSTWARKVFRTRCLKRPFQDTHGFSRAALRRP